MNWIRKQCFTSDHFKGCIDALLLTDELEIIKNYIKQANGSQPPVSNHKQHSDDSEESLENYSIYSRKWKKNYSRKLFALVLISSYDSCDHTFIWFGFMYATQLCVIMWFLSQGEILEKKRECFIRKWISNNESPCNLHAVHFVPGKIQWIVGKILKRCSVIRNHDLNVIGKFSTRKKNQKNNHI